MDKKPTRFDDLTEIARPVPVDATSYRLPSEVELELDDNDEWMIAWRAGGDAAPLRTHDDWMLSDFMELRDAEPEQIKEFAANWGTLQLCGHGKPQTHLPRRLWDELAEFEQAPCDVLRAYPGGWRTESVTRWRQYAAQATAIHRIALKLKAEREINRADLDPLKDLSRSSRQETTAPSTSAQNAECPTHQDRKPRVGESNYCESCGDKVRIPARNRQRKRRAKGGSQTNT